MSDHRPPDAPEHRSSVTLSEAASDDDLRAVATLGAAFAAWDAAECVRLDLSVEELAGFQHDYGLDKLRRTYAAPGNVMLIARRDGTVAGCGGVVALEPGIAEIKTVWVDPAHRGHGIGATLVDSLLDRARTLGYRMIRLETVTFMDSAVQLYRSRGFAPCAPYYRIPESFLPVTIFMERPLDDV